MSAKCFYQFVDCFGFDSWCCCCLSVKIVHHKLCKIQMHCTRTLHFSRHTTIYRDQMTSWISISSELSEYEYTRTHRNWKWFDTIKFLTHSETTHIHLNETETRIFTNIQNSLISFTLFMVPNLFYCTFTLWAVRIHWALSILAKILWPAHITIDVFTPQMDFIYFSFTLSLHTI